MKVVYPGIAVFENVISDELCDQLIEGAKEHKQWFRSRVAGSRHRSSEEQLSYVADNRTSNFIMLNAYSDDLEKKVIEVSDKVFAEYDEKVWKVPANHKYEAPYILRYERGQKFLNHIDLRHVGVDHYRLYSSVLYLNDCEGGDLLFTNFGKVVPNKKGSMVIFPSFETYRHQSNPVISGVKYSIPIWRYYPRLIHQWEIEK